MADSIRRTIALSGKRRALLEALLPEAEASGGSAPIRRHADGGPAPLSFAQRGLWFLHQVDPTSSNYHVPCVGRFRGPLQPAALERGLGELIRRHEILRSTIAPGPDGEPAQRVNPALPVTLTVTELSHWPAAERARRAQQLVAEQYEPPFELTRGPLWRGQLLRFGETEHLLVLIFHHLVFDGWSDGVLWSELAASYDGFVREQPVALPPLAVQYADFAAWQRQWLTGDVLAHQLSYWKKQLGGELPTLTLPGGRPRSEQPQNRAGRVSFALPAGLSAALQKLSQESGTTLFMTLLAGFQALLHRYTGQDDIVVGSPIAGRNRRETEAMIGFFVNLLVFRANLSGQPTFRELLQRSRDVAFDAFSHQDLPFEKLVEELRPERDLRRNPLAPVVFQLQAEAPAKPFAAGLELTPENYPFAAAKFDLTLEVTDAPDGLRCAADYNAELFDAETMQRLLGHYQMLIEAIVRDPDQRLSALPLLTAAERQQLLEGWNDTALAVPGASVPELFAAQVARAPGAVAVVFGAEQLTYGELNTRANRLAHHLRGLGVGPEQLVGIFLERSLELLVSVLAVQKAGAAYVPLDPAYPASRVALMLEDSGAAVIVTQAKLAGSLPAHAARLVRVDGDSTAIAQASHENPTPAPGREQLAYVLYTSGSTGRPKGVEIEQGALVNFLESMRRVPGFGPTDVLLAVTTLSFDIAGLELYLPLVSGGCVELASREQAMDAAYLQTRLASGRVTLLQATPVTWRLLLEAGWAGTPGLKVLCGGEAMPRDLAAALVPRAAEVWNMYGPTETTVWSTAGRVEAGREVVTVGRPIANTRVYVLDAYQQPVPVGVAGELYIGGSGVARGYRNRPDLTAEKFVTDPFTPATGARMYRTGDLARFLADGQLEVLGRLDQQVKVRGFRIELGEIEAALSGHPAVREAVVLVRDGASGGRQLVAYVVVKGTAPAVGELRQHLKERLPDYMVPAGFVFLEKFPLTPNGKVDRKALPAPEAERAETATTFEAPRGATETALAAIWRDVLRLPRVGRHGNFFEVGGHSLLAIRILARARETIGVELTLRDLFEQPTVAGLAAQAETIRACQRSASREAALVPAGHEAGEI